MQETWVRSLSREDPLEKEMTTHSSTLAWRIPWREEPGRLIVHGVAKSWTQLSDFTLTFKKRNSSKFTGTTDESNLLKKEFLGLAS